MPCMAAVIMRAFKDAKMAQGGCGLEVSGQGAVAGVL